jgi:hypothetical protein
MIGETRVLANCGYGYGTPILTSVDTNASHHVR